MHLGVIPDGNRRYARKNGLDQEQAYEKAIDVIKSIGRKLKDDYRDEIDEVTFYLLSEENLNRDDRELENLYELFIKYSEEVAEHYSKNGFQVNWASTREEPLPEKLKNKLLELEERFNEGDKTINLLISYSGKQDILEAAEKVSENGKDFTEDDFSSELELETDIDYVVRTGDNPTRECLSGFPIWNSSYAEYYHIKKHFPNVKAEDVESALEHFKDLRRKKGA
jgi:undecaprenyl diphosphate synthase